MATPNKTIRLTKAQRLLQRQLTKQWANAMRDARRANKLTQVQLAKRAAIPPMAISRIEAGTVIPTNPERRKLRAVLKNLPPTPNIFATPRATPASGSASRAKALLTPAVGLYADFANLLRAARADAGITRLQLARATKVSPNSVANWESGGHLPQSALMERLRGVLAQQWATRRKGQSLSQWEATAGRLARRRVPVDEQARLRSQLAHVRGAYALVSQVVTGVIAGKLTPPQVALLRAMVRQMNPMPRKSDDDASDAEAAPVARPPRKRSARKRAPRKSATPTT